MAFASLRWPTSTSSSSARPLSSPSPSPSLLRGSEVFGSDRELLRLPCTCSPSAPKTPSTLTVRMAVKRWEKKEVKANSLPVRLKVHVKVGDTVQVIAGKDKGKVSEVMRVYTHDSTVLLRDINIKTKHVKGKAKEEAGQIIQVEKPVHSSNVMLYSKAEKVASRVGHRILEDGSKVRYLVKTGEVIDKPEAWKRTPRKEKKSEGGASA